MADKIPVYGELDCRTAENIIADAEQIRYDTTKNIKEKIEELENNGGGGGGGGIPTIKYTTSVFVGLKDIGPFGTKNATLKLYLFSVNRTTLSDVLRQYSIDVIGNEVTSATLSYKDGDDNDNYVEVIKCVIAREESSPNMIIRVTYRIIEEMVGSENVKFLLNNTYETVFYESDNVSFTYRDIG